MLYIVSGVVIILGLFLYAAHRQDEYNKKITNNWEDYPL